MPIPQSQGEKMIDGVRVDAGYEQLAVSNAAAGVGGTKIPAASGGALYGATGVLITVETAAVRWRSDGVAPTATVGNPLDVGVPFFYTGDPSRLLFIRQTIDAVVNLNYFY